MDTHPTPVCRITSLLVLNKYQIRASSKLKNGPLWVLSLQVSLNRTLFVSALRNHFTSEIRAKWNHANILNTFHLSVALHASVFIKTVIKSCSCVGFTGKKTRKKTTTSLSGEHLGFGQCHQEAKCAGSKSRAAGGFENFQTTQCHNCCRNKLYSHVPGHLWGKDWMEQG